MTAVFNEGMKQGMPRLVKIIGIEPAEYELMSERELKTFLRGSESKMSEYFDGMFNVTYVTPHGQKLDVRFGCGFELDDAVLIGSRGGEDTHSVLPFKTEADVRGYVRRKGLGFKGRCFFEDVEDGLGLQCDILHEEYADPIRGRLAKRYGDFEIDVSYKRYRNRPAVTPLV